MQIRVKFSIRVKLFLLVLISFGILMSVITWRIAVESRAVADQAIDKSLTQSNVILQEHLNARFDAIYTTTKSLGSDPRVLPLVIEHDVMTLQDFAKELQVDAEFDIVFFTDENGVLLARSDKKTAQLGARLKGKSHLVDQALAGERSQGFMVTGGNLLQVVSAPIYDNVVQARIRGTVAVAYRLSPEIAKDINTVTESEIGFYLFRKNKPSDVDPQLAKHYLTDGHLSEMLYPVLLEKKLYQKIHWRGSTEQRFLMDLDGETFNAAVHPLEKSGGGILGFVLSLRSQTELLKPFRAIIQQILLLGVLCLIAASVIAWWIASRITKPIIRLVDVTHQIQDGQYPQESQRYRVMDEVGVLYDAVFQMGHELKDKAELEDYLANIAEGLEEDEHVLTVPEPFGASFTLPEPEHSGDIGATLAIAIEPNAHAIEAGERVDISATQPALNPSQYLQIGKLFADRYQISRILGVGSMGCVYVAKDITLDEIVALKVLFQQAAQTEKEHVFKEEIRLARIITHRNILRTYDFGEYEDQIYISMEYVHGHDLNELLRKTGQFDLKIGVMLARQICSAVTAAHNEGIIHRDLNPRNMMVNKQGILKVMDFGLAMRVDEGVHSSQQQLIVGTPYYLSPEQILREQLDVRTDIYAIGVILFKIFSGRTPYEGNELAQVLKMHLSAPTPDLCEFAPGVPPALAAIAAKAVAKERLDRYQTVSAMQADLQQLVL